MMPKRLRKVNLMDRIPAGSKLVTRGTRYGNPFRVESANDGESNVWIIVDLNHERDKGPIGAVRAEFLATHEGRAEARREAVRLFREWLHGDDPRAAKMRMEAREHLRGVDVVCMCDFSGPCHGDVLMEVANG